MLPWSHLQLLCFLALICSYFYSSFFGTKEFGKSSTVSSIDGCKDNYPEITILKITLCDDW